MGITIVSIKKVTGCTGNIDWSRLSILKAFRLVNDNKKFIKCSLCVIIYSGGYQNLTRISKPSNSRASIRNEGVTHARGKLCSIIIQYSE